MNQAQRVGLALYVLWVAALGLTGLWLDWYGRSPVTFGLVLLAGALVAVSRAGRAESPRDAIRDWFDWGAGSNMLFLAIMFISVLVLLAVAR